ncbi:MAG: SpoIIE family protein phosphatase [Proteobacteria bacterium]|nr:SpoIIE family protein phosphatase [Pseudomonadota bacterium]
MNYFPESVFAMIKNRGIAFRLGAPILAGAALIFMVVFTFGYFFSREAILRNVENNAQNIAKQTAHRIESVLAPVQKLPVNLTAAIETLDLSETEMIDVLGKTLSKNPEIFGAAIAFEPYAFKSDRLYFCPYLFHKEKGLEHTYLDGKNYHYFYQDWYQIPRETLQEYWSEPYFDEGGGDILMATFSCPFFKKKEGKRLFAGVITADISLEWLKKFVSEIRILKTGYGFILSRNGSFVAHPEKRWVMNETIFSIAEARGDAKLRNIGRRMIAGESGFVSFTGYDLKKAGFLYFAPVKFSKWSLGIFFPKDELMADLDDINKKGIYLAVCGLIVLFLVVWLVSKTITRPLRTLSVVAREMATGNLEIVVPNQKSGGEVGLLAESFNFMKDSLKIHIQDLLEATAAKKSFESELNIARDIQMGFLPKDFNPFPDIPEFDLYAFIKPAKEVGGDLYDFYRIDDERICFVLGDVSGKGVPASLFMAVTMTLIKMTAAKGLSPDLILQEVNSQLSRDNEANMFVTLFCGILNIRTGELWYANGGHNPPVLLQKNGEAVFLEGTDGVLLGAMDGIEYEMKKIRLDAGEGLFIYSDGITEAMDEKENLYSEERLLELFKSMEPLPSSQVVDVVISSVLSFAGQAPQTDDITVMMLRFWGNENILMQG